MSSKHTKRGRRERFRRHLAWRSYFWTEGCVGPWFCRVCHATVAEGEAHAPWCKVAPWEGP